MKRPLSLLQRREREREKTTNALSLFFFFFFFFFLFDPRARALLNEETQAKDRAKFYMFRVSTSLEPFLFFFEAEEHNNKARKNA